MLRHYLFAPPENPFVLVKTPELNALVQKLNELLSQDAILQKDTGNPRSAVKHTIFSFVISAIRQAINHYNETLIQGYQQQTMTDLKRIELMLTLVQEIKKIMNLHYTNQQRNRALLNLSRNRNKQLAKDCIDSSVVIAPIAIGWGTSSFLMFLAALMSVSHIDQSIQHTAGLDDDRTTSVQLFDEIITLLQDNEVYIHQLLPHCQRADTLSLENAVGPDKEYLLVQEEKLNESPYPTPSAPPRLG